MSSLSPPTRPIGFKPVRRLLTFALLALALLAATGLGYGTYLLSRLAPIGTAYAARTLCSGVFVAGRQAEDVKREDILADNHPLLRLVRASVDIARQRASATFAGMAKREAQYRPGLGCVLVIDSTADLLRAVAVTGEMAVRNASKAPNVDFPADPSPRGIDSQKLAQAVDAAFTEPDPGRLQRTRAVVVLRDGRIVAERYALGFSADTAMLGWSMTKSVTAALIGILVQQNKLALERNGLLPQWTGAGDPRTGITLDNLLRMTSGLRFTEDHGDPLEDVALMLFTRADAAAYAIDKPLDFAPGTHWSYSSGSSNVLSAIMRQALGGNPQEYLSFPRRALFDRIGMRHAVLETDSSQTFVASSYMYASARDWARFGQLLLQDGVWRGERLLPSGWVRYMSTLTPQSKRRDFGAHLWVKVPPPFDSIEQPRPQVPRDAFHAVGFEGQFVSVIPSRRMVVVRLGLSRGNHVWDHDAFLERLIAAVSD